MQVKGGRTYLLLCLPAALVAVSGAPEAAPLAAPLNEAGVCKAYQLVDDARGEVIVGAEDITVDRAAGAVYVSAYDRRAVEAEVKAGGPVTTEGGIYRFPLPDGLPEGDRIAAADVSRAFRSDHDFRPHGFHLGAGDPARLHVVNRVYEMRGGKPVINPAIERFRLEGAALIHEATIRPGPGEPAMCSPNDLWARDDGAFYVSNDHRACAGFGRAWEETFALRRSYLLFYDGARFRKVADRLAFANGVTGREDPATGARQIIVSETRGKRLRVYDERDLLAPGEARPRHVVKLGGGPDNITWTGDGDLLVAAIPNILGFAFYRRGWFGKKKTASRVYRVPWGSERPGEPEIAFEDGGAMISAATVMAAGGGLYFVGAVLDDNIVICDAGEEE